MYNKSKSNKEYNKKYNKSNKKYNKNKSNKTVSQQNTEIQNQICLTCNGYSFKISLPSLFHYVFMYVIHKLIH